MGGDISWKLEFGSPEWLAFFGRLVAAKIALDGDRTPRVLCEVYLDPPAHLRPAGHDRIAWTCRVDDKDIHFTPTECPDDVADVKTVGEYRAFLELLRFVRRPDNDAEFGQRVNVLVGANRIRSIRDNRTSKPPPNYLFHNLVAAITR